MKMKFVDNFDFLLKIDDRIIDSFTSSLRVGFDRMHSEREKRGKDVELYYKNKDCYRYEKLSDTSIYRGKNEKKCNSIGNISGI